jgi:large subunit ribosomal protein L5
MAKTTSKRDQFKPEGPRIEDIEDVRVPARLHAFYKESVVPALMKRFNYSSIMQVPCIEKIAINIGVGAATQDTKMLQSAVNELELIVGQRPAVSRATKSIANFKLREGMPIGTRVTLRRAHMYEFLDRFINIAAPRIRDFRGLSPKQFDGKGNYTFGLTEQNVFHEISQDDIDRVRGMDITIVTTARTNEEGLSLLTALGFPFKKPNN